MTALVHHINDVLRRIDADKVPKLMICNKIDQLDRHARLDRDHDGQIIRAWVYQQKQVKG